MWGRVRGGSVLGGCGAEVLGGCALYICSLAFECCSCTIASVWCQPYCIAK